MIVGYAGTPLDSPDHKMGLSLHAGSAPESSPGTLGTIAMLHFVLPAVLTLMSAAWLRRIG